MPSDVEFLRRQLRPRGLALIGIASLVGSLVAFEVWWNASESEVTTTSIVATIAWFVLGVCATAVLASAAAWAAWGALHRKAVVLVGMPVAAGVVGLLLLAYALRVVHDLPD